MRCKNYLHTFAKTKESTMALRIISARDFSVKMKCAIHASGKLGFTDATADVLKFGGNSAVKFAVDDEDDTLYLVSTTANDTDAFKVNRAGNYCYISAKPVFDSLGLDYINNSIIFDMIKVKESVDEMYKLLKREKPRKQKQQ